jgi:hypothetical protein
MTMTLQLAVEETETDLTCQSDWVADGAALEGRTSLSFVFCRSLHQGEGSFEN